jgi:cyclase
MRQLKTFAMVLTGLMVIGLTVDAALAQGRQQEGDLKVTPVRGNIYLLQMGSAGNVAVSAGDDGAFLIDDQFAPMTDRILDAIGELTDQPVRYVLNTHWHGDHTGGNVNLGELGYTIVAHDNVRARMETPQFHLLFMTGTRPHPPASLPVITYSDRMTFHFNGERIDVIHLPVSHTDGDSAFFFRGTNVLHTGDAFINRGYPLIDVASGGTIKGQIEATNRMIELIDDDTIIIPGHGPLTDKQRMIDIRDMLVTARQNVVALLDKGLSLKEIQAEKPLAALDPIWVEGLIQGRAFVKIIYQSETGDWSVPDDTQRWDE